MSAPDTITLKSIDMEAPWRWLTAGAEDFRRSFFVSLLYGLIFVAGGLLITVGLWRAGVSALIPVAAGGFALLAPMLAVGLYEISRRQNEEENVDLGSALFVRTAAPSQLALIGFALAFCFLVWANLARLLFALFIHGDYPTLQEFGAFVLTNPDGLMLISIGTLVGAAIAFVVFMISAISIPILMRRDVDVITAVEASVRAVRENRGPMLLWAWLIAVITAVGIATAFIGLAFAFPLLGHATWHAYRDLVEPKAPEAAAPVAAIEAAPSS